MFGLDLFELLVIGFIAAMAVVLVAVIVVVVSTASRNREGARLTGVDTIQGQGPPVPSATRSIEARLQELDSLRARGVISYDEYVAARQRAIDGQSAT
jgi:hypothetical protein